jgi:hypothetical protein
MSKRKDRSRAWSAVLAGGLVVLLAIEAGAQTIDKLKQFGSTGDDVVEATVAGKGVYLAGHTTGAIAGAFTNLGGADAWIRKQRAGGRKLWVDQFGTSGDDFIYGAATGGGVYVAGSTSGTLPGQDSAGGASDAFIRKYKTDGTLLWTRQFGTNGADVATDVTVDASGNVFVSGHTSGAFPLFSNPAGTDIFLRRYDSSGNNPLTQQFGTTDGMDAMGLGVIADETGVVVAGETAGRLPGQTPDGGIDAFMRKYETGLAAPIWMRQFGTTMDDHFGDIDLSGGLIAVSGDTAGLFPGQVEKDGLDAWVRTYDGNGVKQWTRQFGTNEDDIGTAVSVNATGVTVAGSTKGQFRLQLNKGGEDVVVRRYDSTGQGQWLIQFGGGDHDRPLTVDTTAGYALVAGWTAGAIVDAATNKGLKDAWWGKILLA